MTDLENIYVPQGHETSIFLLDAILLSRVTQLRNCWFLSSIRVLGTPQTDAVSRPGWFSDTAPYTLAVSMWSLVSSEVSARCRRCGFCFSLYIWTLRYTRYFPVALKPMMKRDCLRNVWLTFTILCVNLNFPSSFIRFIVQRSLFQLFFSRIFISLWRIIVK